MKRNKEVSVKDVTDIAKLFMMLDPVSKARMEGYIQAKHEDQEEIAKLKILAKQDKTGGLQTAI